MNNAAVLEFLGKIDAGRPVLKKAFIYDKTAYICDGFRVYRFRRIPDFIPVNAKKDHTKQMRETLEKLFRAPDNMTRILFPSMEALKKTARLKEQEFRGKPSATPWYYLDEKHAVSAPFLIDIKKTFPDVTCIEYAKNNVISPVYITSSDADIVVLPIRVETITDAFRKAREGAYNPEEAATLFNLD